MQQGRHVNFHAILLTLAVFCFFAMRDPSLCREVCSLSHVETLVKTPMVTVRERDHELPGLLHCVRHCDGLPHQHCRCDHGVLVPQKLAALAVQQRPLALCQRFDPIGAVR